MMMLVDQLVLVVQPVTLCVQELHTCPVLSTSC